MCTNILHEAFKVFPCIAETAVCVRETKTATHFSPALV